MDRHRAYKGAEVTALRTERAFFFFLSAFAHENRTIRLGFSPMAMRGWGQLRANCSSFVILLSCRKTERSHGGSLFRRVFEGKIFEISRSETIGIKFEEESENVYNNISRIDRGDTKSSPECLWLENDDLLRVYILYAILHVYPSTLFNILIV